MKKLLIILSIISSIVALILSVLPLSNLAYIPAILAFVFGIIALVIKKDSTGKKTVNLAFLLTIIALGFTVYKSIFTTSEVGNIEELEQKAEQSVDEAIETLESEIEILDDEPTTNIIPDDEEQDEVITDTVEAIEVDSLPEVSPNTPKKEEVLDDF